MGVWFIGEKPSAGIPSWKEGGGGKETMQLGYKLTRE